MVYGVLDINKGGGGWAHGYTVRIGKWKFSSFDQPLKVKTCSQTGSLSPRVFEKLKEKYDEKDWISYTQRHTRMTSKYASMSPRFSQG